MAGSFPSVHFDSKNTSYIQDHTGAQNNRDTFDTRWSFETEGGVRATPVIDNELLVVSDTNGIAYGIDAIDGRQHWRTELAVPGVFASPAVADGVVFICGYDDLNRTSKTAYALDLASGDIVWTREFRQGSKTPIKTADGRIFLRTNDGNCRALAAQTGETVWQIDCESSSGPPAIADETVIFGDGTDLVAVDAKSGVQSWRQKLDGRLRTPPVVADDRAYIVTGSSKLRCLDIDSGDRHWGVNIGQGIRDDPDAEDPLIPLGGGVLDSKPVFNETSIFIGIYKGLVKLDAVSGQFLRYHALNKRLTNPLLVEGDRERYLYGNVRDEGLTEFHLTDSGIVPQRTMNNCISVTGPAYTDGVIYLGTELGTVQALS